MAKFEVEFELKEIKLRIRGEREDIPLIASQLGQGVAQAFVPLAEIVEGTPPGGGAKTSAPHPTPIDSARRKVKRVASTSRSSSSSSVTAPQFRHDAGSWGTPKQEWKLTDKLLWLIYVVKQQSSVGELSGAAMVNLFNLHFKQAGLVKLKRVTEALGRLKQESPPAVNEDATKNPTTWFLTQEGERRAAALIAQARGEPLFQGAGGGAAG